MQIFFGRILKYVYVSGNPILHTTGQQPYSFYGVSDNLFFSNINPKRHVRYTSIVKKKRTKYK